MPNRNYLVGRALEYSEKKQLEEEGWEVLRTSGSHGRFDLIAIKGQTILLIQLKSVLGQVSPRIETVITYGATVQEKLIKVRRLRRSKKVG